MDDARSSVLYINPQGIARDALAKFKTTFLNSTSGNMFVVEETSLSFRDLLAKTRHDAREAGVECPGFLVFDKESAAKHAVLFVEASCWVDGPSPTVKGMECRYPSAATTWKFYCAIGYAGSHMASLDVGCTSWSETWEDVKSRKRGAVLYTQYQLTGTQ